MPCPAESLPILETLPRLRAVLQQQCNAVLVAPPGAGKTTGAPLALLDEPWVQGRKLILLEPRRLAAQGAANRMAEIMGEEVGGLIGLRMRMGVKTSNRTRIEVVTEGVFVRMILDDPELSGVAAVLFDEFHERSLDADLGLALALDAQRGLREDLRLLVMSATIDGARVASLLGATPENPAPVIESQGRAYPVETRYRSRRPDKRIEEDVSAAVIEALRTEEGSMLVFLPGQAEIRRTETLLAERLDKTGIDIAPLYGALDRAVQTLAIRPAAPGRRKVVLATSIAETSLTIDGIRIVIDSGLARVPRYEPDIGITRLETVRASRAAADQRRGRAGRTQSGICIRLWEEAATGALPAYSAPEILSADLAPMLLDCAAWGVNDPARLPFLDLPPAAAVTEAGKLLRKLHALDEDGRLTPTGARMQSLPLPPRLARMVIEADKWGAAHEAAGLAALLVERGLGGNSVDLAAQHDHFRRDRSRRSEDMRQLARNWARLAADGRPEASSSTAGIGLLLALAYPDRIARAQGKDGRFVMANGRGAALDTMERLSQEPFLVIAEVAGSAAAGRILSAAAISAEDIAAIASGDCATTVETTFDTTAKALRCRELRRLGAIVLDQRPLPVPATIESATILAQGISGVGLHVLPWSKPILQWRERVAFLHRAEPDMAWPDVSDEALSATMDDWLAPHIIGCSGVAQISTDAVDGALRALLPWELRDRLEREAPSHFTAPTGSRIPVDYSGETPSIAVRVQELFGLTAHPALAGGRILLTLELLSPAHRPIQITRDLPGFWQGSWAAVRAEMRGRYPKHVWPEDPVAQAPTTRAKPRPSK